MYSHPATGVCRNFFFTNRHSICFEKDIKLSKKHRKVMTLKAIGRRVLKGGSDIPRCDHLVF